MAHSSWGSGWPNCQRSKIKTLVRKDGLKIPLREELLQLVAMLMDECERRGYDIRPDWTWGFACRAIAGTRTASNHSWGLAVDINAPANPDTRRSGRRRITNIPDWMVHLWERFGFRWGGRYFDFMHFEFMGSVAQCMEFTALARKEFYGTKPPSTVVSTVEDRPWPGNPSREYGGYNRREFASKFDGNVLWIQQKLNSDTNLSPKLLADGRYGPKTEDAVFGFQRAIQGRVGVEKFAPRMGVVDQGTWQWINDIKP